MVSAQNWKLALFEGALLILFGFLAMSHPYITTVSLAALLGAFLMVAGAVMAYRTLQHRAQSDYWLSLATAFLFFVVGLLMLISTQLAIFTLTGLVTAYFVVDGFFRLSTLWMLPPDLRSGWIFLSGVMSILLAILIWTGWPFTALWFVGFLFGINLVVSGALLLALALAARRS